MGHRGRSSLIQDHTGTAVVECDWQAPIGAWVVVRGLWDGHRVQPARTQVVSVVPTDFPRPGGEWDWAKNECLRLMKARHAAMRATRAFFDSRGFVEVETPCLVPSPGLELHLNAFEVVDAGAPRWLSTSPEYQMKRLLTAGLPRIYQICKCFRKGEEGRLHQPEFTMLEWYCSFAGSDQMMRDTEELVAHAVRALHQGSTRIRGRRGWIELQPPWQRLTVAEAFRRYAQLDAAEAARDEETFFRVLIEQVEPNLGRDAPVFLTGYPAAMASLARLDPNDPTVADRFEAYVDGVELCNGFGELTDPVEQRRRLAADQRARQERGKTVYPLDERFLAALEEGMPPSGGNALGMDRLVMLLLGAEHIDEVVAFPATRL